MSPSAGRRRSCVSRAATRRALTHAKTGWRRGTEQPSRAHISCGVCKPRRLPVKTSALQLLAVFGAATLRSGCSSSPTEPHVFRVNAVDSIALGGTPFAVAISPVGITYVTQSAAGSAARANQPSPPFSQLVPVGPLPSQERVLRVRAVRPGGSVGSRELLNRRR